MSAATKTNANTSAFLLKNCNLICTFSWGSTLNDVLTYLTNRDVSQSTWWLANPHWLREMCYLFLGCFTLHWSLCKFFFEESWVFNQCFIQEGCSTPGWTHTPNRTHNLESITGSIYTGNEKLREKRNLALLPDKNCYFESVIEWKQLEQNTDECFESTGNKRWRKVDERNTQFGERSQTGGQYSQKYGSDSYPNNPNITQ